MTIYRTDTHRYIITATALDYTLHGDIVQTDAICPADVSTLMDAPTLDMAVCIQMAAQMIPSPDDHRAHSADLLGSITRIACDAANAHKQCLAIQATQPPHIPSAYPHIYSTDRGRYAISQRHLCYATAPQDPAQLIEEAIRAEDLTATCYVSDIRLATFLAKATCGIFHGTSSASCAHHNAVQFDDYGEIVIRTGATYAPLSDVLAHSTQLEQRMYLSAAETQLALCRLYLALAQRPVAG